MIKIEVLSAITWWPSWPQVFNSRLTYFHFTTVHGGCSSWGAWGSCSRTCGTGTLNRQRSCTAPAPKYGGRSCTGPLTQGISCLITHCPGKYDFYWYHKYTYIMNMNNDFCTLGTPRACVLNFSTFRSRRLWNNDVKWASLDPKSCWQWCDGPFILCPQVFDSRLISFHFTTVHGGWSSWGGWSPCSTSCGTGFQNRYRSCTSPAPAHGGRSCPGSSSQSMSCTSRPCPGDYSCQPLLTTICSKNLLSIFSILFRFPFNSNTVDGGWSNWSGWNSCNMPCGTGSQQRSRSCTNPPPLYGGKSCSGTEREERSCNQHSCPGEKLHSPKN